MTADPRLRWIALGSAVAALLIRVPFAARRMWDHDSIQFALGVERYDLAAHHPHPPGYPLYIGILKLLAALGLDPLHGMVALAILGGALGAACIVLLTGRAGTLTPPAPLSHPHSHPPGRGGRQIFAWLGRASRRAFPPLPGGGSADGRGGQGVRVPAAAFAGVLYAFNPLLWFYGELPLIYALEGGLSVAVAYGALRMSESRRAFLLACALMAVAGGLRQSTLVLLAPLFLFGLFRTWRRGRLTPSLFFGGAALGVALVLAWFVPLCLLAGGYGAYRRISTAHFGTLLPQTSVLYGAGWGALAHNVEVLTKWALQGIFPGAVALLLVWATAPRQVLPGLRLLASRLSWLLAWALPPVLFFALFHITKAGYTLIHLPALLTALALAAAPALAASRPRALAATAVAAMVGAGLFLFGADRRPDQPKPWAIVRHEFNQGTIAEYELGLDRTLEAIRSWSPADTVLAAVELSGTGGSGAEGFLCPWQRHLQWYLPEYPLVFLVPEQGFAEATQAHRPFQRVQGTIELPAATRRIVFVLSGLPGNRLALPLGEVRRTGEDFYVLAVPFSGAMKVGPLTLTAQRARKAA
ncbi:MAG TPA: DUF2723 domain-containing protein [Thermoanaerobaculia bacterium]